MFSSVDNRISKGKLSHNLKEKPCAAQITTTALSQREDSMSASSSIEWTDATWNPVRGCQKVSPGCKFCYAEAFAERWRGVPGHPYEQGFDLRLVRDHLELPLRWKKSKLIFVNSMSDLYQDGVDDNFIFDVFKTMKRAQWHTFQVLTKRSERLAALAAKLDWAPNVWQGVSVESAAYVSRIDDLLRAEAAIRFLSVEPLLGPIPDLPLDGIHWVIVGGESGPRARPMNEKWVLDIRDRCARANVPFFFKQWGGRNKAAAGRILEGVQWNQMPARPSPETVLA
jgi:protein gp37